jgi:hypothetical protein
VGTKRYSPTAACRRLASRNASRPSYHNGAGGNDTRTSARSSCASAAVSLRSSASTQRASSAPSSRVESATDHSARRSGSRSRKVARARCSALLTAATLKSSSPAVSLVDQPTTSRRISTARWPGGRCWIAAMNASSIVSRSITTASGPSSPDAGSSRSG